MVTTTSTAPSEEHRRPPRKKPIVTTGVWPCKINGCNKQFAREADLKRHQRTTKMHSMPSFSCPQCDANFTRTDALRRHQKSRHDGIVIEPVEQRIGGDENADGSSRSTSPSSKGKEKESNIPVQTHQGAPTHTGPSSYYRSHTVTITPHVQNKTTTSSRTDPPWPDYPSSWQNGALPPNMGPIGYLPHPIYYPSPHYRPHTNGYHTGHAPDYHPHMHPGTSSGSTSRNSSSQPPNSHSSPIPPSHSQSPTSGTGSVRDRTLDDHDELTEAEVVAAVQAVLMQAESEEAAKKQRQKELEEKERYAVGAESRDTNSDFDPTDNRHSVERSIGMDDVDDILHVYGRPEPMDHILTEDGEPMLNPAELLTQESLASPPPS